MFAFWGKIAHVDLASGNAELEKLPEETYRYYLGGRGLGTFLLHREVDPGIYPLSPLNKLIFATGPLSDSPIWGSSRYAVLSKSPLTGGYADLYAGGDLAPAIKKCGLDALIITGSSPEPVYLLIKPEQVEIRKASELWGKDTYYTIEALERSHGKGARAIVIGPAGENQVRIASLHNNYGRSASRCGLGAVAGSKMLKGIVFQGNLTTPYAHRNQLQQIAREQRLQYQHSPTSQTLREEGTVSGVALMNTAGGFPTGYWQEGILPNWEQVNSQYMQENLPVKSKSCRRCFLFCGKYNQVLQGDYAGSEVEGPEFETIYAFAGLCRITSFEGLVYLNELCDRLGMDTISAGNLASFAIEAGRRGMAPFQLDYGDPAGTGELLRKIARREGNAQKLGEGIKEASRYWGIEDLAIQVKGLEPAAYDPRRLPGMGLAYATAPRGACHLRTNFYIPELKGEVSSEDLPHLVERFCDYEENYTLMDSLILCRFYRNFLGWDYYQQVLEAATGWKYLEGDLKKVASRIIDTSRRFNQEAGIVPGEDHLPDRFFKEPLYYGNEPGPVLDLEVFEEMLQLYYRKRGWNKSGICSRR